LIGIPLINLSLQNHEFILLDFSWRMKKGNSLIRNWKAAILSALRPPRLQGGLFVASRN
jgi:hypothetical protein